MAARAGVFDTPAVGNYGSQRTTAARAESQRRSGAFVELGHDPYAAGR
ncbi:hypothetical protein ACFUJR_35165 [Streptomyces sp. NPDC057271]